MNCPICGESRQEYLFIKFGFTFQKCSACGLIRSDALDRKSRMFRTNDNPIANRRDSSGVHTASIETEIIHSYFSQLKQKGLAENSRVLLVAENDTQLLEFGEHFHLSIHRIASCKALDALKSDETFDAAVIICQLEKSVRPDLVLRKINALLKTDAPVMLVVPSLDSRAARLFGSSWTEWRPENRIYFSGTTIQLLLWKSGFSRVEIRDDHRSSSFTHINLRAGDFPRTWLTRVVRVIYRLLPGFSRAWKISLPSSRIVVLCRKDIPSEIQKCSFIIPAFNESSTFPVLMSSLLKKNLPACTKKEIIIVESNSSDGTRELAAEYEDKNGITVIYQDQPRGKGNAVRAGFEKAAGDMIIIQDADLEYDLNDVDELLAPILRYQVPFVLGSRHGGQWKMRQFSDEKGLSAFFNFGHQLFTGLLNLLYGQKLKDPFTMYKVFRRDCLHGLLLEANRFDFDFELVIKLIRKGYTPLEIPVNYRSRSFKEGKKVRVFRDPLTWIWALIKYRFAPIFRQGKNDKSQ